MTIYGALMRKNGILLLKQYRAQITIVFSLKLC